MKKEKFYCFKSHSDELEPDYEEFTDGITYEGKLSKDGEKLEITANRGEPVTFFFGGWRKYFRKQV